MLSTHKKKIIIFNNIIFRSHAIYTESASGAPLTATKGIRIIVAKQRLWSIFKTYE